MILLEYMQRKHQVAKTVLVEATYQRQVSPSTLKKKRIKDQES